MAQNSVGKLQKIKAEAAALLDEKELALQAAARPSRGRQIAHFWVLVLRSFIRNRCPVRASALAYTTLLALIPMLAVVISVSTSLIKSKGEAPVQRLIDRVVGEVAPQLDLVPKTNLTAQAASDLGRTHEPAGRSVVAKSITEYIRNIQSGTLGVTGMVSLILVAILLLSNIESTFNDIWGVVRGRSWYNRVVQYWAVLTLGPILLVLAIGLTSGPYFEATQKLLAFLPWVGKGLFALLPFAVLIGGFAVFYGLMPNTRVQWRAALAGGAVGGCLWQLNNLFNVIYVSKVVTYSKIYGSFGMVPVFLIGMYFSWLILLFGAQVAYAYQNRQSYLQEKLAEGIHQRSREFVALRLMTLVGQRFNQGEKPPSAMELSEALGVPSRLTIQMLGLLVKARWLLETGTLEVGYAPARPLRQISCHDVLQAVRTSQGTEIQTREDPARNIVRQELDRIQQAEQQAATTTTLQDLVDHLQEFSPKA